VEEAAAVQGQRKVERQLIKKRRRVKESNRRD
jgi:hypothetical protein